MSSTAIGLVLVSAAVHVLWNVLLKASANPRHFSLLKGAVTSSVALLAMPFLPVAAIPSEVWPFIVASGVIHAVYAFALSTAYAHGDISYVYPIARSAPAFVPIAAFFFLGEVPSTQGTVGILVVVAGIIALQARKGGGGWRGFLGSLDFAWAFLTLVSVVAYTIVDKAGMVRLHGSAVPAGLRGPVYFIIENLICTVLFWAWCLLRGERDFGTTLRRANWRIPTAAACTLVSYSLILHVMQSEPVSYIVTLRQSSVVMAVLAGAIYMKEERTAGRLGIAIAMLAGFYLIVDA